MSFNQELKDFLNGFTATKKMLDYSEQDYRRSATALNRQKLADAQDPELRELGRQKLRTAISLGGAQAGNINARTGMLQDPNEIALRRRATESQITYRNMVADRMKALNEGRYPPGAAPGVPAPAIDNPDGSIPGVSSSAPYSPDTPGYAEGGLVVDDEDDDDDFEGDVDNPFSTTAGHDAVLEGLKFAQNQYGGTPAPAPHTAIQTPAGPPPQQAVVNYMRGRGAADQQIMEAIHKKIDPEGKMSESARALAGLSAAYQYYMRNNEPKKAQAAASALLQRHRMNFNHYSVMAKAAAAGGKLDAASAYAAKAYASIPNGQDVKFVMQDGKLGYEITDEVSGTVVKRGIMSPQEFSAKIMGMNADTFDRDLAQMAGIREREKKAPKLLSGEKAEEITKRGVLVEAAVPDPTLTGGAPDKGLSDIRSITDALIRYNPGRPEDAGKMARMLLDPTQTPNITKAEGGAVYNFKGSPRYFVPNELIEQIAEMRAAMPDPDNDYENSIGKSRAPSDPRSAEPGVVSGVADTISDFGGRVADEMKTDDADRQSRAIEAEKAPRKSYTTSGAMRRLARDQAIRIEAAQRDRGRSRTAVAANDEE